MKTDKHTYADKLNKNSKGKVHQLNITPVIIRQRDRG